VKLVYIHVAFSPRTARAAEVAECAYRQGKFWTYKDRLFENQLDWLRAEDWRQRQLAFGREIGLDMAGLNRCLEAGDGKRALQEDLRAADAQRIEFTPTIIMGDGRRFVGSDMGALREALAGTLTKGGGR
jgi:protein-disulfide isomerase